MIFLRQPTSKPALTASSKQKSPKSAKLLAISQEFHDGCVKVVRAAVGEDDCIGVLRTALKAMDHSKLSLRKKADWRVELKPTIQQPAFNLSFVGGYQQQEIDDASAQPQKRHQQQASPTYISPRPSRMKDKDNSPIKTPRPDITIGLESTALISALSSQNLNNTEASRFLKLLQNTMMRREPDGPDEPMLCSVPMQHASDLVFPFAVVEGKAYSTGKPIFEAENQAAVSGACGLKILLCLDELAKDARTSSDVLPTPSNPTPPSSSPSAPKAPPTSSGPTTPPSKTVCASSI